MSKKRAHKDIEDALEIDSEDKGNEEEDNAQLLERLAKFKEMKEESKEKASADDNEFIKETLRELALMGLHAGRVLEDEIEVHAKGRDVECLAGIMNATRDALKKLQDVELDEQKMTLEQQKVAIRQSNSGQPRLTQNNMFVGSHADMLKALKDATPMEDEDNEVIEVDDKKEN